MGADLTSYTTWIQGLVIQDSRFVAANIDASLSTASQAGPIPGIPIAQQDSDLVLDAVGSQSAGKQLRARAQRSGHPGTDEASLLWQYEGDDLWHGWDAPLTISDFEFIDYSTTTNAWRYPDALTTAAGKIVVVAQEGSQKVSSWTRDPATATWTKTQIHDKGTAYGDGAHPCDLLLPSGRILSFFWRPVGNSATVRMHYTDDDGATWKVGQLECLPAPISTTTYTLGRLRAVYLNGQICLLASLYDSSAGTKHQIAQYASDDLGSTFALISTLDTDNSRVKPDMVVSRGKIVVAYISVDPSSDVIPYIRRLGSAHEPLTSASASSARSGSMEWGQQGTGTFSASELTLFVDQDQSLYLLGLDHNAGGGAKKELAALRSADGGETWAAASDSSATADGATLWNARDAAFYPEDFCAVAWRGSGVLIHGGVADAEAVVDAGESLMATFFGGYTTVCMPEFSALGAHELINRASWEHTWLPWCAPEDLPAYTLTQVGAPLPTLIASSLGRGVTHTHVSQQAYWTAQTTDDLASGTIQLVEINHEVNSALTSEVIVVISDGAGSPVSYALSVRVSGTTIALYDSPAGAGGGTLIGTATSATDGMTGVQLLLSVQEVSTGVCHGAAWVRPRGAGAHDWQPVGSIGSSTALTAGTLPTSSVQFGTMTGQATGSALYRLSCWSDSTYVGKQLASVPSNPTDLLGRTIMATLVYIDDGLSLFASDGPTYRPDAWDIDTRYIHSYGNTDPRRCATPRKGHRTLNDAADADIVWKLGETTADEHGLLGPILALYLGEINYRTAEVWGRSGGTWLKVADIDAATGMNGLAFVRHGQSIRPDLIAGSSADRYLLEHILAGSTFDFGTGTPRKIQTNVSGTWTRSNIGATRATRLLLEDYDPTDAASGSSGAIWSKDVLALIPVSATGDFDAFRLRIKAQTTPDGYFSTGIAMVGWLMAYGQPTSIGRAVGSEARYELTEGRNGVRTVRKLSGNRASLEFDWTDGVYSEGLADSPPNPPFIRSYPSGPVLATPSDVPWSMQGAFERACGAVDPVLAATRIPLGSDNSPIILTDRSRFLYGRLVSESFRLDAADGNEWDPDRPEYIRVNTTRVEAEQ